MKKTICKYFFFLIFLVAGFFLQKLIRVFISILRLEHNLPEYIAEHIGVNAKVRITIIFNQVIIEITDQSAETSQEMELTDLVRDYIIRSYPLLNIDRVSIKII